MSDEVNNPDHYNKQGIEVIDVIEAYELPYHLGNVIKYVCRSQYKGKQEQDLRKAFWYLDRYLEEAFDHPRGYNLSEAQAFFDGYDLATDDHLAEKLEVADWGVCDAIDKLDPLAEMETGKPVVTFGDFPTEPMFDVACTFCEEEECTALPGATEPPETLFGVDVDTYVALGPDRIAGDTDTAKAIKDEYYGFDRFAIKGYCYRCDAELHVTQPSIRVDEADLALVFCSYRCVALHQLSGE
jgi:hypothetical protein